MRVTNSMLVSNFLVNLNGNLARLEKLQEQMTTGKKYAHISDNPVAVIYGQQARFKLSRTAHYKQNVETAKDWVMQAETSVMDLNKIVTNVYEMTISTATDIKNGYDMKNSAQYFMQMRDQLLQSLNSTLGDKFLFGGYNTVGYDEAGKTVPPFYVEVDSTTGRNKLYYNDLSVSGQIVAIEDLDLLDTSTGGDKEIYDRFMKDVLTFDIGVGADMPVTINGLALAVFDTKKVYEYDFDSGTTAAAGYSFISDPYYDNHDASKTVNELLDRIAELTNTINDYDTKANQAEIDVANAEANLANVQLQQPYNQVAIQQAKDDLAAAQATHIYNYDRSTEFRLEREDNLRELGKIVNIEYQEDSRDNAGDFNLDIVEKDANGNVGTRINVIVNDTYSPPTGGFTNTTITSEHPRTLYALLDDIYTALNDTTRDPETGEVIGITADKLQRFIPELQMAQGNLLAWTADLGGRDNRLDIMLTRYEQDELNYTIMQSNAEDADESEVIMHFKMAEAVYKAALSSGASIIQPTLMDFLR